MKELVYLVIIVTTIKESMKEIKFLDMKDKAATTIANDIPCF